jgi:flagellar hook-associated protein 1 FlgK
MSGLFATLNASASALQAHALAVEITGKNLANANNASYARQTVSYATGATVVTEQGAQSLGLAANITQIRDTLLDRQVLRETSLSSYSGTLQQALQRAQAGLGQTLSSAASTDGISTVTTDTGLGAALDDFFNSFQALAATPTEAGAKQAVLASADTLASRLQQADATLAQGQADLGTKVASDVSDANSLLHTLADLNTQIVRIEANAPGSAVDLRDQRQDALEKLAALLPVSVTDAGDGAIQVSATGGSGPVVLVDHGAVNGTVAVSGSGTQITAGSPATALALASGSIQGALDARDGALQTLRDQFDQLASQVVSSVNALYNPSGSTGDFFTAGGTTAATLSVSSSLTAATLRAGAAGGAAGDNSVALALGRLAGTKFSVSGGAALDGTMGAFFSSSIAQFGQALASANANVSNQSAIETLVRGQRDSVSGVNLDEETANLLKYQRAFEASSRVLQTVDEMLDQIINQLGR